MGVWNVPKERVEEIGILLRHAGTDPHCYLRPQYPDWRFNIFTMVHSQNASATITS
jgi:hypothetical protein